MSRLKVVSGKEDEFETSWKNRETNTDGVKGFKRLNLIKGNTNKMSSRSSLFIKKHVKTSKTNSSPFLSPR